MIKILDIFTIKSRHFVVKENDMIEVMRLIDAAQDVGYYTDRMSVGNCRCADDLTLWYIEIRLTTNQWCSLLEKCKKKGYILVIKEDPESMYFTKTE